MIIRTAWHWIVHELLHVLTVVVILACAGDPSFLGLPLDGLGGSPGPDQRIPQHLCTFL